MIKISYYFFGLVNGRLGIGAPLVFGFGDVLGVVLGEGGVLIFFDMIKGLSK